MPASKPQRPAQPAPWIICPRCKQAVQYADEDDASEHHLRMAEGLA